MNVIVPRVELVKELTLCEKAITRKPTIPVLVGALVETTATGLTIGATNLEIGLVTRCPATVEAQGKMVAPAVKLLELLRSLSIPDIQLLAEPGAVVVTAGGFRARLQTFAVDDFPRLPEPTGEATDLPGGLLQRLIYRTRFAVTETDKRYYLAGGQLEIGEETLRLVTTDGHRLAKTEGARTKGTAQAPVMLPRKTMDALSSLLDDVEGPVKFQKGDAHLFFDVEGRRLISKQIDDTKFPAYDRIVPKDNPVRITVTRAGLAEALKRAAMLSDGSARKATITSDQLSLAVSAASTDVGSGDEALGDATHEGPPLAFAVNPSYVLDFLDAVGTERVVIAGKTPDRQVLFSPEHDDITYEYVIMPMR